MVLIVCSLTTTPVRLENPEKIIKTLQSLNSQNKKFDAIYLTLPEKSRKTREKYPEPSEEIKRLCTIVKSSQDYGPGTKILGGLLSIKEGYIVTCDDDIIYPQTLRERYDSLITRYPNICLGSAGMIWGQFPALGSILWNQSQDNFFNQLVSPPGDLDKGISVDFLFGYSSVLYPRQAFPKRETYEFQRFLDMMIIDPDLRCNDDIYLSMYVGSRGFERKLFSFDRVHNQRGNEGLSDNSLAFYLSLYRAISAGKELGLFENPQPSSYYHSFGGWITTIILLIILIILILNY